MGMQGEECRIEMHVEVGSDSEGDVGAKPVGVQSRTRAVSTVSREHAQ